LKLFNKNNFLNILTVFFYESIQATFQDIKDKLLRNKIIQMHQIHHVKPLKCNKTEFGSIENSLDPANPCLIRFGKREKF